MANAKNMTNVVANFDAQTKRFEAVKELKKDQFKIFHEKKLKNDSNLNDASRFSVANISGGRHRNFVTQKFRSPKKKI